MFLEECSSSASPSEVGVSRLGEFTEWCFFEPKSQGEVIVVAEILPKNFGIVLSDQTVQTNLHASSALEFENFPIRRLECPRTTPDPSSPTLNRNRATRKEWLQHLVTMDSRSESRMGHVGTDEGHHGGTESQTEVLIHEYKRRTRYCGVVATWFAASQQVVGSCGARSTGSCLIAQV